MNIDQTLQQAVAHQHAGQLQEAGELYLTILQVQPQHALANHNMGVLAVQMNQPAAGLPYFTAALDVDSTRPQFWLSYIDALLQAEQLDDAQQILALARRHGLQGDQVEALATRLQACAAAATPQDNDALADLFNQARYAEAEALAQTLTLRFPQHGFAWLVLGAVLNQMGRSADALAPMQKAVALLPEDAQAHNNLGAVLQHLGRFGEAETVLQRALQIAPNFTDTLYNLGHTLEAAYRNMFDQGASSAFQKNATKRPKVKSAKPEKSSERHRTNPDPQQINTLLTTFTQGRYAEAESLAQAMIERFPRHAFGWMILGAVFKQTGRIADALAPMQKAVTLAPEDADTHINLGIAFKDLGRLDEAAACYRQALKINPGLAEAAYNLGNTLRDLGQLAEAAGCYRRALQSIPNNATAHSNLGAVLQELGQSDTAETSLLRALQIDPHFSDAYYNLGITLQSLGRLEEAETRYRQALKINPQAAAAHCNLGVTLMNLGRLEGAETSFRQALQITPDYTNALNNLALLLNSQGQSMLALSIIKQSLGSKETGEAKRIFVACVKHLPIAHDDLDTRAALIRAVTEPWGRPSELTPTCAALIKLNPDLNARFSDPLLRALLESAPVCDVEMERFLTRARRHMLDAAVALTAADRGTNTELSFYSALAQQCFINEYVFTYTATEIQQVHDLQHSLAAALDAHTPVPALWPLAVAAYFPLGSLAFAARLLDRQWPPAVTTTLQQQVREPAGERQLRGTIPRLTNIEDPVSLQVQDQYETHPYPRWVKTAPAGESKNIGAYLRQKFPLASFKHHRQGDHTDVLVAGCGTGQHPIGTAQRLQGTQILAVDLSMTSLSYAKRKTRELGLTSIEYAQADLLKLGSLGRNFDVIESSGVLHHLADPWTGWRALLSMLRPGGFMKLGFYSATARRNIVRIRTYIHEHGYGSTADDIRQCRQDLMELDNRADFGNTFRSPDFFSTSACRDLLFHVQEHRMVLPEINAFLSANKLQFLGFEIEGEILRAYQQRFPDDRAATDLGQWHTFENDHPDTFGNMYQFWIQKRS